MDVDTEHAWDGDPMLAEKLGMWSEFVGPAVSPEIVAVRWGTTIEALRERSARGELLLITLSDGTELLPSNHLTETDVVVGLPLVTQELTKYSPYERVSMCSWLSSGHPELDGLSPLEWLKQGNDSEMARLVAERDVSRWLQ